MNHLKVCKNFLAIKLHLIGTNEKSSSIFSSKCSDHSSGTKVQGVWILLPGESVKSRAKLCGRKWWKKINVKKKRRQKSCKINQLFGKFLPFKNTTIYITTHHM